MKPRKIVFVIIGILVLGLSILTYQGMNWASETFGPTKYWSILDNSGTHKVEPTVVVASENSLVIGGENYQFPEENFLFMTFHDTKVTIQVDDQTPLEVVQILVYLNEDNPRIAYMITSESDWVRVSFADVEKVTINP
jgi:hypothetical protein